MDTQTPAPAPAPTNTGAFFEKYGTALALLVGLLFIGGVIAYGQNQDRATESTPTAEEVQPVDIADVDTGSSPFAGPADAPITLAVWYDYQCGYCKQFENTTLQQVQAEYGDQVRIVYKDFQFLGAASNETALYGRAVWEAHPDRWEEWFEAVFASEEEGTLTTAGLDAVSSSLGLDVAHIAQLRSSNAGAYQAAIDADREEGQRFGVNGTPGTIVGTTLIEGAQPFEAVKAAIDATLAGKG
jgi:protein-disulfide isomerase